MHIHANGTDIHYAEAGKGAPLVLVHGGFTSTSELWAGHPASYVSRIAPLTDHFRVIAPDTRGHGKTPNFGGAAVSYAQLADDVLALISALDLHRPMLCGFSDGGGIATLAAIRAPERIRALVNDAGFDLFDPASPSIPMMRRMFGGSPTATSPDFDAVERLLSMPEMHGFFDRMKADHGGAWKTMLNDAFARFIAPIGYTLDDLRAITAPTLILTGDRDMCTSVEMAVAAFRTLPNGELAILAGHGHHLPDAAIHVSADFLRRVANA